MAKHDRATEDIDLATRQTIVRVEGPAEIASWFFPNEPADDAQRVAPSRHCSRSASRKRSAPPGHLGKDLARPRASIAPGGTTSRRSRRAISAPTIRTSATPSMPAR